jgi:hypothetical protein
MPELWSGIGGAAEFGGAAGELSEVQSAVSDSGRAAAAEAASGGDAADGACSSSAATNRSAAVAAGGRRGRFTPGAEFGI